MSKVNTSKIIPFFAYLATGLVAVSLLLNVIFENWADPIANLCSSIGQAIAYVVTLIVAGNFVRGKKHVAWLICYIVFAVAIVVLYIVNLVL